MVDIEYEKKWGKGPHLAVDAIVLDRSRRKVLLVLRGSNLLWALPGGFVEPGETLDKATRRELLEETNVNPYAEKIEKRFIVDTVDRDPRSHIVTHVTVFLASYGYWYAYTKPGDDVIEAKWVDWLNLPEKMFADHRKIIDRAIFED